MIPRLARALVPLAAAFFANYLATWVLVLLMIPVIYWLAIIEERELLARFGDEYKDYMRKVPRFVPKLGGS